MDPKATKIPVHQAVYSQLREMILFGDLAPGQAVTILGLTDRLNAGMTPVREALRRLGAEGALQPLGNRRVQVPTLNRAGLEELAFARLALEPQLAFLACDRLKTSDICKLSLCDSELNTTIANGDISGYLRLNYRFHSYLYSLANAPLLQSMVETLWLRAGPSLRVVCGRWGTANLADRHAEALAAMQRNDAVALSQAIADDIRQGIDLVSQSLSD